MDQATAPDKDLSITQAALRAFALYGYRRTSMEDIAQGAGMSRAALYLRFKNKEDIFRSLVRQYYATALSDMAPALSRTDQDAETTLSAALQAKNGAMMELLLTSPHGHELLDAGFAIGADIVAEGEARMTDLLAGFFDARGLAAGYGTPQSFAQMVMAALKGFKTSAADFDALVTSQQQLVRLIARALERDVG
ncbi:TetR family transcriptional regulator [Pseudorhodobacter sp. E13]|uniref:TetR/AcrR family transcriptional regulator n=1 Tax=Pseudorhodobacter sp. E13 TaxID=2487931 RepID=UPI000F8F6B34|nr:TetR/AcrR family transcriptional regulator [Pseudorhodobacter sp. E13]RUS59059.1 TetR family transcriptional regulator [Pseudorhodobacter sp. E13]